MGKKQVEDAVVNVVINGEKAISSFRELNQLRREQARLVETLNRNSPEYAQQQRRLEDLNAAHRVWRQEINNSTSAIDRMNSEMGETSKSGFWDKVKNMFSPGSLMVAGGNLMASGISMAVSAVKDFVTTSTAGYAEAVKGQAQLDAALKSTQGVAGQTKQALNDMAGAIMDQTGVDDDVITKGEELLLTFTNTRGKIYEQALPAIVDMTSAMNQGAVSMEGIQATSIQVGKALNDPIKGITALAKVGVTFTAQQKEQITNLVEGNRMMDAQAIILGELKKEFGGVAKSIADTDVGAMQKFETRMGNIQETVGKWITQGKVMLVEFLAPLVQWLEKVINYFDQAGERGSRFKVFTSDLVKVFKDLWAIIAPLGKALATTFTNTSALQVFASLLNMVVIPLRTIAKVISDIRNGQWTEAFKDATSGMGEWVQNQVKLAKGVIGVGKDLYHSMGTAVDEMGNNLKAKAGGSGGGVSPGAGDGAGILPVIAPTSGPSPAAQAKANAAKQKAAKELAAYKENVKAALAEVNTMIAGSAKGTGESLDAQLTVINDKYQKLIEKLKKLGKGKKGAFSNEIGQLEGARDNEKGSTTSAYNETQRLARKKAAEDQQKDADAFYNGVVGVVDEGFQRKSNELSSQEAVELQTATTEQARLDIKAQYQLLEQQMVLDHLNAIKALEESYGKNTVQTESKIAEQKKKIGETEVANKKTTVEKQNLLEEKRLELAKNIANGLAGLIDLTMSNSKLAIDLQKAVVLAQVAIDTASAISSVTSQNAKTSLTPIDYAIRVAAAVVTVISSMARAKAALSQSNNIEVKRTQKFEQGGILPDGPSHNNGGLKLVDPYGLVFGEVEGGEPILSKNTYANNRGLVDALLNSNGRQLNLARVQDATDSRERRMSNTANSGNAGTTAGVSANNTDLGTFMDFWGGKMDAMASAIQDQQIILSTRLFREEMQKEVRLTNEANA